VLTNFKIYEGNRLIGVCDSFLKEKKCSGGTSPLNAKNEAHMAASTIFLRDAWKIGYDYWSNTSNESNDK